MINSTHAQAPAAPPLIQSFPIGGVPVATGGQAFVDAITTGLTTFKDAFISGVFEYTLLYGALLAVSIAWGQAGIGQTLPNYFLGAIVVLGANVIMEVYTAIF